MSIENHPNFHAVKFVTAITVSYFDSLRGRGATCTVGMNDAVKESIEKFVTEIEDIVDHEVEKIVGGQHND